MKRPTRISGCGSLVFILILVACHGDPVSPDIAMQHDVNGDALVIGTRCNTAGPVVVSLYASADGRRGQLLWQVKSPEEPAPPVIVEVGATPSGYEQTLGLAHPLVPDATYVAEVAWANQGADAMFFTPNALPSGDVMTALGDIVPKEDFVLGRLRQWCGRDYSLPPG
jgi:hypothetical protein